MKRVRTRNRMSMRKRLLIIAAIIVPILAAIGIYVFMSYQTWTSTNTQSSEAASQLKTAIESELAGETPPASLEVAITKTLEQYEAISKNGPCALPALYEWQSKLSWFTDSRTECLDRIASSEALAETLTPLQAYLEREAAAAELTKKTIADTAGVTDYPAAASTWQALAVNQDLVAEGPFKPAGTTIAEVAKAISDAYTTLDAAIKSENRASFDEAESNLTAAYARVAEIPVAAQAARAPLIDQVIKAYEQL